MVSLHILKFEIPVQSIAMPIFILCFHPGPILLSVSIKSNSIRLSAEETSATNFGSFLIWIVVTLALTSLSIFLASNHLSFFDDRTSDSESGGASSTTYERWSLSTRLCCQRRYVKNCSFCVLCSDFDSSLTQNVHVIYDFLLCEPINCSSLNDSFFFNLFSLSLLPP